MEVNPKDLFIQNEVSDQGTCNVDVTILFTGKDKECKHWQRGIISFQTFTQSCYCTHNGHLDRLKGSEKTWKGHQFKKKNVSSFITAARFPISRWMNPQTSSPHTNWSSSCHGNRSGSGSDILGQTLNVIPLCCGLFKQPINGHLAGAVHFGTSLKRTVSFTLSVSGTELHFLFVLP